MLKAMQPRVRTLIRMGLAAGGIVVPGCFDYGYHKQMEVPGGSDQHDTSNWGESASDLKTCKMDHRLPWGSAIDESCMTEPNYGPLDAVVEWSITQWGDYAESGDALTVPVVGQLTDDNGDGRIDSTDTPDIVVVTDDDGTDPLTRGVLRIVAGDGSRQLTIQHADYGEMQIFPYRYASVALGDVDGDGMPDIVGIVEIVNLGPPDSGSGPPDPGDTGLDTAWSDPPVFAPNPADDICYLAAWTPQGGILWVNSTEQMDCGGHSPALADLEGDGKAEIIVGSRVFDGTTGNLDWSGSAGGDGRYADYPMVGDQSFAIDLDGDGLQEVLAGSTVYNWDGSVRCSIDSTLDDGFPAAADFDGDGIGEFVLVGNGYAHVHDANCRLEAEWPLVGMGNGGPPTIADFDGDGKPEIGIAEATTYSVYRADGAVLWSMPTTDASSHATGSSVYDFDGDGRAEVVYGDETTLWVFDGSTGAVRLQDTTHSSRTLHEYPVVADVDGDGQEEIVVGQGGGHYDQQYHGIYVLGSASGSWLGDRQVWNQHAYSITNINDDLSLPTPAVSNWPTYNTFRSGSLSPMSGGATPDAIPYVTSCANPCADGRLEVLVRVGNGGMAVMRGRVPVSAYAEVGGQRVFLQTLYTGPITAPGWNSATLEFHLHPEDVPEGVVWIVVDDADGVQEVAECHEDNNEARLGGLFCPADSGSDSRGASDSTP